MVRSRSVEINQFIQAEQHMRQAFEAIGMGLQKALRGLLLGGGGRTREHRSVGTLDELGVVTRPTSLSQTPRQIFRATVHERAVHHEQGLRRDGGDGALSHAFDGLWRIEGGQQWMRLAALHPRVEGAAIVQRVRLRLATRAEVESAGDAEQRVAHGLGRESLWTPAPEQLVLRVLGGAGGIPRGALPPG